MGERGHLGRPIGAAVVELYEPPECRGTGRSPGGAGK